MKIPFLQLSLTSRFNDLKKRGKKDRVASTVAALRNFGSYHENTGFRVPFLLTFQLY